MNAPIDDLHAECIAAADGIRRRFELARLEAAARVSMLGLRLERRLPRIINDRQGKHL